MGFWNGFSDGSGLDKAKENIFGKKDDKEAKETPLLERFGRGVGIILVWSIKLPYRALKRLYELRMEQERKLEAEEKRRPKKKKNKKKKQGGLLETSDFGKIY